MEPGKKDTWKDHGEGEFKAVAEFLPLIHTEVRSCEFSSPVRASRLCRITIKSGTTGIYTLRSYIPRSGYIINEGVFKTENFLFLKDQSPFLSV